MRKCFYQLSNPGSLCWWVRNDRSFDETDGIWKLLDFPSFRLSAPLKRWWAFTGEPLQGWKTVKNWQAKLLWRSNIAARHCQDHLRALQHTLLFSSPKVFLSANEALTRGYSLDLPLKHLLVFKEGHGREQSGQTQAFFLMLGSCYLPLLIFYSSLCFIFALTDSVPLLYIRVASERRPSPQLRKGIALYKI